MTAGQCLRLCPPGTTSPEGLESHMLEELFLVETLVKSGQMKNVRLSDFGAEV